MGECLTVWECEVRTSLITLSPETFSNCITPLYTDFRAHANARILEA